MGKYRRILAAESRRLGRGGGRGRSAQGDIFGDGQTGDFSPYIRIDREQRLLGGAKGAYRRELLRIAQVLEQAGLRALSCAGAVVKGVFAEAQTARCAMKLLQNGFGGGAVLPRGRGDEHLFQHIKTRAAKGAGQGARCAVLPVMSRLPHHSLLFSVFLPLAFFAQVV